MSKQTTIATPVHAFCSTLAEGLPADIQWMPPGEHDITASRNGAQYKARMKVDEAVAARLQKRFEQMVADAQANKGDRPFIDFNHEDREAAGHVQSIYWGGDDPVSGGVRLRVEWTEQGKQGLMGRAWRRFSPSFYPNEKGEVVDIPVNMGGLVNRAAFKSIAPIWSKDMPVNEDRLRALAKRLGVTFETLAQALSEDEGDRAGDNKTGGQPPQQTNKQMSEKNDDRLAALETTVKVLTTKVNAAESKNLVLETQLSAVKASSEVQAKAFATERVRAAVNAGKIPPQDAVLIEKWTGLIAADAKNVELLDALPENPALKKMVENPGKAGGTTTATHAGGTDEHAFIVKAREFGQSNGIKGDLDAQTAFAATKEGGELYKEFRSNYAEVKK